MTPRYRHYIQPAAEGKWPDPLVCLDCTSQADANQGGNGASVERLASWEARLLLPLHGVYRDIDGFGGTTDAALWALLERSGASWPNLWVVSVHCARVWALLGLWQRIESGAVRITDHNPRDARARHDREGAYRRTLLNPLRQLSSDERRRLDRGSGGYLVMEDSPNILRCRVGASTHTLTWVDIRNYGVDSMDSVAPGADTVNRLSALLVRMLELCRTHSLGALCATSGSQAMRAWRHSCLEDRVHVHTEPQATALEAAAYVGGRCEPRYCGVVHAGGMHVDLRSAYGWVQANGALPVRLRGCDRPGDGGMRQMSDPACGLIADVTVQTEEPAYPCRRRDDVIYPVGTFRTTLCGPELADALRLLRVRAVHACASYEMGTPLKTYAERMYALRCQEEANGVPGSAAWVKSMLVCLPGKLGQLNHRWVDCPNVPAPAPYGEWTGEDEDGEAVRYRAVAWQVQRDVCDGFAADSVPAIAAWVTSHARMRLLGCIRAGGWDHVYYYDTDSLIVDEVGYAALQRSEYMQGSGLGMLTVRSQPQRLEIRGVKYYVEDGKVTCAGLPKGHITDAGDGLHYTRSLTPTEQARHGHRPVAAVIHGTYARCEAYRGGTVQPDGSVVPIRLDEGD